jgi:glycosyltransferase involved in cell wall biosynthesis
MISVLIPVYNTNILYLRECIESVLNQTYKDFEIVIINNGSTDESTNAFLNLLRGFDRIKIHNCPREFGKKNLSVALNFGLTKCKYEYVARMDSDDIMVSTRLEDQINYMKEHTEVDILGGKVKNMFGAQIETNHPSYVPPFFYKVSTFFLSHPAVMYKRSKIVSIGGYPDYPDKISEDYMLWARCLRAGMVIHNLQNIIVYYRNRDDNLSEIDSKHPNWYESIRSEMLK